MPLKLSLKPGETFILNGAVIRNGERRGVLLLENHARILREKDIMRPEEACTPASKAYFAIMQMYLSGATDGPDHEQAAMALTDLLTACNDAGDRREVTDISAEITSGNHYKALGRCRKLMNRLDASGHAEVA